MQLTNSLRIKTVTPRPCKVCPAPATHLISYDGGGGQVIGGRRVADFTNWACDQHVPEVTAIVLLQAGFTQGVQDQPKVEEGQHGM